MTASDRGTPPPNAGESAPPPKQHARYGEAAVYVDGEPKAVLRFMELPPRLEPVAQPALGGTVDRYLLADYLRVEGIDLAKVRAVHLYGGQRVSPLTGDEVRSHAKELSFEFGGGDRGKPRIHYCADITPPARIDMISAMVVYVDKEPPVYHPDARGGFLAFADGAPIEGIPYAPREQSKGTRVYVDGELAGVVRRRQLPDQLVVGRVDKETQFSLSAYLRSIGVDATKSRAVDLISGDDLVERLDARSWSEQKESLSFTIPAHSQGQIVVGLQGTDGERAKISAVQIFSRLEPPRRWVAPTEYVAMGDGNASNDPGDVP
ncbi:MAG TPA: hypothetical protein VIF09_12420 [Polyangiaceae bacterium]